MDELVLWSNMTGDTFYYPTGASVTRAELLEAYPILSTATCVISTDTTHVMFGGYSLLSVLASNYNISTTGLTDEEILAAIIIAKTAEEDPEESLEDKVTVLTEDVEAQAEVLDYLLTKVIPSL